MRAVLSDELVEQLVPLINRSNSPVVANFCKRLEQRLAVIEFDRRKLHDKQTRDEAGEALAAYVNEQQRLKQLPAEPAPNHPNSEDD